MQTKAIVFLFFILVTIIFFSRPKEFRSQSLFLLRGFFPSWKFFDRLGSHLSIQVRELDSSKWEDLFPPIFFQLRSLVFNPETNLRLAHQNLLQELLTEFNESEFSNISELPNFQILKQMIRFELKQQNRFQNSFRLEFIFVVTNQADADSTNEILTKSLVEI